jgi:hypothetical protein
MELTKEQLIKILSEQSSEIDEYKKHIDPKREGGSGAEYKTKGRSDTDFIKDKNGVTVGFKVTDLNTNVKMPIFHVCGGVDEVQQILNENPELIQTLKEEFPDTQIKWTQVKKSIACLKEPTRRSSFQIHPLPGEEGETMTASTRSDYSNVDPEKRTQERMKKTVREIVDLELGDDNPETQKRLIKCTIPLIHGGKGKDGNKFLDRHAMKSGNAEVTRDTEDKWTNSYFKYATMNSNLYPDANSLLNYAIDIMRNSNTEPVFVEKPLKRITITKKPKWSEYQAANIHYTDKIEYQGKTPFYGLNKWGTSEQEFQIVVKSRLEIVGKLKSELVLVI